MKQSVLIAIPCLKVGGTEMQTLRLVEALTDRGYHCVTVCYFEYDFAMRQRFESAGSKVVCLSAYGQRPQRQIDVYRFLKQGLKRVVQEYRPKIAHVQYMAPGAIPIMILKRLGVKTIIATLHTDASIYKSLKLVHFLQRHVVTAFTCVSQKAEQSFFGNSNLLDDKTILNKRNHFTIYNCLGAKYAVKPEASAFTTPDEAVIGIVARLEKIKGADLVIPAFAKILQHSSKYRLLIVGDGQLREMMKQQQQELGVDESRVIWAGRVDYEKLTDFYSQMTVVWMPSRSEGFGLSAVEAMANGCPVIASRVGGLEEIIKDNINGVLFKSEDINDLVDKTIALLERKDLLQMKQQAIAQAQRFSFEHYATLIGSLYSKL